MKLIAAVLFAALLVGCTNHVIVPVPVDPVTGEPTAPSPAATSGFAKFWERALETQEKEAEDVAEIRQQLPKDRACPPLPDPPANRRALDEYARVIAQMYLTCATM